MRRKRSFLERSYFLIVAGLLAGALGGLAIGVATNKSSSTAPTATATPH